MIMMRDIKYTLTLIRRNPGVTSAILIAMATGIAVTSARFALVSGVLLHPLPP
jgi:tetrahydromethanopterin S-methyltransferase subunit F